MLKGSGRTERMIREAVEAAKDDKHIMVLISHPHMITHMIDRICNMIGSFPTVRKVGDSAKVYIGKGSIVIELPTRIDLKVGIVPGYKYEDIFMDHHVLEKYMPWAFHQWVRWSLPGEEDWYYNKVMKSIPEEDQKQYQTLHLSSDTES